MRVVIDTEPFLDIDKPPHDTDPFSGEDFEIPDDLWEDLCAARAALHRAERDVLEVVAPLPGAEYIRDYLAQEADRG